MARKAIEVLAGPNGDQPFYLMVEAASIDKQSHSGHFAGALWDVIEFDKAVGVGRAWAAERKSADTLMVVTADHGQPMLIIGTAELSDADYLRSHLDQHHYCRRPDRDAHSKGLSGRQRQHPHATSLCQLRRQERPARRDGHRRLRQHGLPRLHGCRRRWLP